MQTPCDAKPDIRERLAELRRAARTLKPTVKGSEDDRKAAAVKGYRTWADTRARANKKATR
jgi:hypothetical protein